MVSLAEVVGSYTPLLRSGDQWLGKCPFAEHEGELEVIGERWRCVCGAHAQGDDALGFLVAKGLSVEDAQARLANGHDWTPTLELPERVPGKWGLHRITERPDATVLITDHRRAAEVADRLLGKYYVVVAWPDGEAKWELEPLRGRTVLLWPGPLGVEAMQRLEAVLADPAGLGCTGKVIEPLGAQDFSLIAFEGDSNALITWAKAHNRPLALPNPAPLGPMNPAPAVVPDPPSSEAQETGKAEAEAPIPFASPAPQVAGPAINAPEPAQDARSEPPSHPDLNPPPEGATERPKRRRLRVAGGTDITEPDPADAPLPVEMGEDQLALRFAVQHGEDWRYVKRWNQWFHYDGDGWRRDDVDLIDRLAVEFCRQAAHWPEARVLTPDGRRKLAQRRTAGQVRDMARNDRQIAATVEQWDNDPLLVGVPGGVYCVESGKIIEGERGHYVTKRCAVAPEHGKPARWLEHLHRMMQGDEAMINFLHLFFGYCATGATTESMFAFLYGMGQTGKGVTLLTVGHLLGDYAVFSEASTFLKRQGDKHLSELARFMNARMVIIDEVPSGSVWNEERIKRCTGGGKLTVNFMHSDPFDMPIKFKLAVAGNSKPQLRRVGKEMQRRIRLVRCNAMVPDDEVNQNFRAQLIAEEGPQILNWILEGAVRWREEGLPLPEGISDASREYLEGEDFIGDWLAECTTHEGDTRRPDAYANFKAWYLKQGNDHAWSPQSWWSAMEDRGYTIRRSASDRFVRGLSLRLGSNL